MTTNRKPARTFTRHDAAELIRGTVEDSAAPDAILDAARKWGSKKLTAHFLKLLPGGADRWRLVREHGWTNVAEKTYGMTGGRQGISVMVLRTESSEPIDAAWIEKENACYYSARRERNHRRMEALNDAATLDALAEYLTTSAAAVSALFHAIDSVDFYFPHNGTLNPVRYEAMRAAGLYDSTPNRNSILSRDYKRAE